MSDLIITDDNWQSVCFSPNTDHLCGTKPRDFAQVPFGSLPFAAAVGESVPTIPMEEWPDRIADLEREKATLKHIWAEAGIGVWDQNPLSYCHGYSAVMVAAVQRAVQGLPFVELSASSVAAPVTNYRNEGAYIHDDLQQMCDVGIASIKFVPMKTYRKGDFRDGWKEDAAHNKVIEWWDVPPRNFLLHGSLLLQGIPVGVGLNWWGHAVTDLVLRDVEKSRSATDWRRYGIEFLNSWNVNWGNKGFGVRTGDKAKADSIYAVRQLCVA